MSPRSCKGATDTALFWQHDSYDRLVRDAREFGRIENYIVQNSMRAGLAARREVPVVGAG
jgi:hypothetical protein